MTPQERQMLRELYEFMQRMKENPLGYPMSDLALRSIEQRLLTVTTNGTGSTALTQTYNVAGGGGGSITGPKAYTDTIKLVSGGITYEVPYVG